MASAMPRHSGRWPRLIRAEDWRAALETVWRALRDDGWFVLIDNLQDLDHAQTGRHVVIRSQAQYRRVLPEVGLELWEPP